ncbi:FtsB family cell division protein [Ancylomarina longa]|uniref:Septum formation initiator family protein n=1 Tax=Ancylomarina longa TaxID=2487017 RepID=A0A434AFR1_9BACT|nr:septum formation initiator family protein [Ancylomarina longa]RUT73226.1 septum formation initiator family protein [Ancylomarina longa]
MNPKKTQNIFLRILRNKYLITFLIFYVWLFFFDQNSIWERKGNESTIESLEKEKAYFLDKIEHDKKRIHELKTNRKNLEKFAREQYLMKKKNEDIFIVIKEE